MADLFGPQAGIVIQPVNKLADGDFPLMNDSRPLQVLYLKWRLKPFVDLAHPPAAFRLEIADQPNRRRLPVLQLPAQKPIVTAESIIIILAQVLRQRPGQNFVVIQNHFRTGLLLVLPVAPAGKISNHI